MFDQTVKQWTEQESKQEALLRLICHYLIYIGRATSLIDSSSEEKTLLEKWRSQWNKPAAFTWNCQDGLQMHYRIEPPANWIVSSSEDESLNSINVDLSEFDDIAMFTEDGDLVKCVSCGTLWTDLDEAGHCLICQSPEYQDEGFTQLISFESDFDFSTDSMIFADTQSIVDVFGQSFEAGNIMEGTNSGKFSGTGRELVAPNSKGFTFEQNIENVSSFPNFMTEIPENPDHRTTNAISKKRLRPGH